MRRNAMRMPIAAGVGLLVATGAMLAQAPGPTRTVLQQVEISAPGREVVTARVEFPMGAAAGRHTHPGEEVSYVLEGTLSLQIDGAQPRTVKAGEAFVIPAGKIHNATATSGKAALVVNYIVEKGKPLVTPVP